MQRFIASLSIPMSPEPLRFLQRGSAPLALFSLALLILHAGCTSNRKFAVSAINNPSVEARQTFVLVNGNVDESDDGLRFQEMVEIIKLELATRGMYEAPNHAAADVMIRVETRVEPFYKSMEVPDVRYSSPPGRYDSEVAQNVSHIRKTIRVMFYKTVLSLTAIENSTGSSVPPALVWKVEAAAESEKVDLRAVVPGLASTAADYIGEETTEELRARARSSPSSVQHVPNRSSLIAR